MLGVMVLLVSLLALPFEAGALGLPVTYLVQMEDFHRDVSADSVLSFNLYADRDCTALVHVEDLPAGTLQILTEKLEPRPRAADPQEPLLALRLLTSLDPSVTEGPWFLQVSGEGIVPRGRQCQAQRNPASTASLSGPLFDADGGVLGDAAGSLDAEINTVLNREVGLVFSFDSGSGQVFSVFGDLLFEQPDCQGPAYTNAPMDGLLLTNEFWGQPRRVFLASAPSIPGEVETRSRIQPTGSGRCENTRGTFENLVGAQEVSNEVLGFTIPVALPVGFSSAIR
jgi:hypothetical protein